MRFSYKVQPSPDGLAQAFLLGEEFIDGEPCALVLGDNIFYGNGLGATLRGAVRKAENGGGATVFGYYVDDPERYGVVEFNENKKAISIMEKPEPSGFQLCGYRLVLLRRARHRIRQAD